MKRMANLIIYFDYRINYLESLYQICIIIIYCLWSWFNVSILFIRKEPTLYRHTNLERKTTSLGLLIVLALKPHLTPTAVGLIISLRRLAKAVGPPCAEFSVWAYDRDMNSSSNNNKYNHNLSLSFALKYPEILYCRKEKTF